MMNNYMAMILLRIKLLTKRRLFLLTTVMTMCLSLLVASYITSDVAERKGIPVVVVDYDQSEYSTLVINRIKENKSSVMVITATNTRDAIKLIKAEKVEAAFIFEKGFMENLMDKNHEQIVTIIQSPTAISIGLVREIFAGEINRLSSNIAASYFIEDIFERFQLKKPINLWENAWHHTDDQWEPVPLMSLTYSELDQYSNRALLEKKWQEKKQNIRLLLGIISLLFMIIIFMINQWTITERNDGIMTRISLTSVNVSTYVFANTIVTLGYSIILILPVFIYLYFKLLLPLSMVASLLFVFVLFGLCIVGLSMFVATISKSVKVYQLIVIALAIGTSILGGSFIKLSDLTDRFSDLAVITPQHWLQSVINHALAGTPLSNMVVPLSILISISSLFYLLAYITMEVKHD
jgi:ABC-2 type transport system permease protein